MNISNLALSNRVTCPLPSRRFFPSLRLSLPSSSHPERMMNLLGRKPSCAPSLRYSFSRYDRSIERNGGLEGGGRGSAVRSSRAFFDVFPDPANWTETGNLYARGRFLFFRVSDSFRSRGSERNNRERSICGAPARELSDAEGGTNSSSFTALRRGKCRMNGENRFARLESRRES